MMECLCCCYLKASVSAVTLPLAAQLLRFLIGALGLGDKLAVTLCAV